MFPGDHADAYELYDTVTSVTVRLDLSSDPVEQECFNRPYAMHSDF